MSYNSPMSTPLRVLIVEDSEDDTLLLLRELERGDFEPIYERVDTLEAIGLALDTRIWDIILCDYIIPGFDGMDVLKLMQSKKLDIPFIIVSGKIDESTAVAAIKAGAHDFVKKDNLIRMAPVIERELQEAETRRQLKQYIEKAKVLKSIVDRSPVIAFLWRIAGDWPVDFVSENVTQLGYTTDDFISGIVSWPNIIFPEDLPQLKIEVDKYLKEGALESTQNYRLYNKFGAIRWMEHHSRPIINSQGVVTHIQGLIMDITEQKRIENVWGDFVSDISQQLRDPAAKAQEEIKQLMDSLRDDSNSNRQTLLQLIGQNINHLSAFINNLPETYKIEAGKMVAHKEWPKSEAKNT